MTDRDDASPGDSDAAENEVDDGPVETAAAGPGWTSALPVAIVLAAVTVVAIAGGAWLMADPPDTPYEVESANRQDALASGDRFASTLTSFDATRTSEYVEAVTDQLADGEDSPCWGEVAKLVPAVADEATAQAAEQREQLYQGSVRDRAVESIDSDSARILLVVEFQMSAIVEEQRVPLAAQRLRLRADLENTGGDWLVDGCTIVQPGVDGGGGQ
ncbi:MAG: hypothetical protein ACRDO7_13765 [Nocardioidaceae bacterium]